MQEHPIMSVITIIVLVLCAISGAFMGGVIGLLLIFLGVIGAFYVIRHA